jgi:hypothetical protein
VRPTASRSRSSDILYRWRWRRPLGLGRIGLRIDVQGLERGCNELGRRAMVIDSGVSAADDLQRFQQHTGARPKLFTGAVTGHDLNRAGRPMFERHHPPTLANARVQAHIAVVVDEVQLVIGHFRSSGCHAGRQQAIADPASMDQRQQLTAPLSRIGMQIEPAIGRLSPREASESLNS